MPIDRSHRRTRRPTALVLAVAALTIPLLAVACGDSKDDTASPDTTAATTTSTAAPTTTTTVPGPQKFTITAKDYAFETVPSTISVGSSFALTNSSAKEVHEMVVFQLPDTETRTAEEFAKLSVADISKAIGAPPTMVLVAPPSNAGFAVVGDGTITKPGRYLALCAIPTGADPAAYMAAAAKSKGGPVDVPGGPPHYMEGMITEFTAQ